MNFLKSPLLVIANFFISLFVSSFIATNISALVSILQPPCSGFLCGWFFVIYIVWIILFLATFIFLSYHLAKLFAPTDAKGHFIVVLSLLLIPIFTAVFWFLFIH